MPQIKIECPDCKGTGIEISKYSIHMDCGSCGGDGFYMEKVKPIRIKHTIEIIMEEDPTNWDPPKSGEFLEDSILRQVKEYIKDNGDYVFFSRSSFKPKRVYVKPKILKSEIIKD